MPQRPVLKSVAPRNRRSQRKFAPSLSAVWATPRRKAGLLAAFALALLLGFVLRSAPAFKAEITLIPPEYAHLPSVVLAGSEGQRAARSHNAEATEGSVINVRLKKESGATPVLTFDGVDQPFAEEGAKDSPDKTLAANVALDRPTTEPHILRLALDAHEGGVWRIRVRADKPPQIAITAPPANTGPHTTRLSFEAEGAYPIQGIEAEIAPIAPEATNARTRVKLSAPRAKSVQEMLFTDLTDQPLAGKPVSLRLIAIDAAGHEGMSDPVTLTLPERAFKNPLALALLEERQKLLKSPDAPTRDAVANIMAGVAHQQPSYGYDLVVLMALRGGAVRLVLDPTAATAQIVGDLLWHVAARIEDGSASVALEKMREIGRGLSDALERENNEAEIDTLLALEHEALTDYLDALAERGVPQPQQLEGRGPLFESQKTPLGQEELHGRIEAMRRVALENKRGELREELASWQDMIENLHLAARPLSLEQRNALEALVALRALAHDQQTLRDQMAAGLKAKSAATKKVKQIWLARQKEILKRARLVLDALQKDGAFEDLGVEAGEAAMTRAAENIEAGALQAASQQQFGATLALNKALHALTDKIRGIGLAAEGGDGAAP
jgi:hypothetical protein